MNPAFSAAHLRSFLPLFQRVTGKVWFSHLLGRDLTLTIAHPACGEVEGGACYDF